MVVDLRSDTFTLPTPGMLAAMASAKVGDDVFSEDPTMNALQEYAADLFGMEAALFFPSGTMANQTAIRTHTRPGEELICDAGAHVHYYEGGGIAANSGVSVNLIQGERGVFTAVDVEARVRPDNVHFPVSRIVCIENTCNRGGGRVFPVENVKEIYQTCKKHGLKLHLDGARLFNAMLAEGTTPRQQGELYDSISLCLSKGLGAPVGSLLLGDDAFIHQARRVRKMMGGGMRQAGFLAAAGLYALQNQVARLEQDHLHAKLLADTLSSLPYIKDVLPQQTNIVSFRLSESVETDHFLGHLSKNGVLAMSLGPHMVRFVTHLGMDHTGVEYAIRTLRGYSPLS
ncbi:MAG: aminotransferase class I/II-fold pyridoxal phosphate-dependent enzyme [Flavobacteriales bacterium]|nr:aminotransferase class I/II-fold pyridoxal phosphate-dependent enzyme [Flavobacteriales bacterium]